MRRPNMDTLTRDIVGLRFKQQHQFILFDIVRLYPSMPLAQTIVAVRRFLEQPFPDMEFMDCEMVDEVDLLVELLTVVLINSYIYFNRRYWKANISIPIGGACCQGSSRDISAFR